MSELQSTERRNGNVFRTVFQELTDSVEHTSPGSWFQAVGPAIYGEWPSAEVYTLDEWPGRRGWQNAASVGSFRLTRLVGTNRRDTSVRIRAAPWTLADTTWTGRAAEPEASEDGPAGHAWCGHAYLSRPIVELQYSGPLKSS